MKRFLTSALLVMTCFVTSTTVSTQTAAALPDLVPSSVSFNRSSRSPGASVANEGDMAIDSTEKFVVTFYLYDSNGERVGTTMTQSLSSAYQGLQPGRSVFVSANGYSLLTEDQSKRVARIKAVIDSSEKVVESDENNNEKTVVVEGAVTTRGPGAQPDLVVTNATLDRNNGTTRVQVLNKGTFDLVRPDIYSVRVEYLDDAGSIVISESDRGPGTNGLLKDRSEQLDDFVKISPERVNRIARMRVTVDPGNTQPELDETNNVFEIDVPGEHGLPDLTVPFASFSPSSRFTSVSIKNIGTITVPSNTGITVRVEYLDSDGAVVVTGGGAHVSALSPNTNGYPLQRFFPQPSEEQAERIVSVRATVDPNNTIEESNEENNFWPVPTPAPVVVEVPDDTVVVEETNGTVNAQVEADTDVGVLPTSRLYMFKQLARTIRSAFTFNKEKKADLHRQYAQDVLNETRVVQGSASEEVMKQQLERYKKEVKKIEAIVGEVEKKDMKLAEHLADILANDLKVHQVLLDDIEQAIPSVNTDTQKLIHEEVRRTVETTLVRLEEKRVEETWEQKKEEVLKPVEPVAKKPEPAIEENVETRPTQLPTSGSGSTEKPKSTDSNRTEPAKETNNNTSVKMGLGEGVIRVESADPEIVKGRQVEFPVVLERSNIVDLQFDIEYNSALLSLNKQSGAEHSLGAVVEPLNLTSRATISTQLGTGKATIHIVSKEPLLNLGGPLSIAKLRFTILGVANQEMVVTPKNVIATDASGAQIPVTVSAGKVRVIAPAALTCEKEIFAPVCGLDEKTYDNACEAKRAGVVVRSSEPCKADLISTETYPSMVEMKLTTSGFSPFVIDIAAGGTIVFINNDVVSHIIVRNEDKTERIDPGEKTMMKLPNNRAIYTIESEQQPDFAATVVVH